MALPTASAPPPPALEPLPSVWRRIAAPAALTLAITLARLYAELAKVPDFVAGREPGGNFALLGIAWLPPVLGWWFARGIVGRSDRPKRALAKTLIAYGFAARLPIVAITWIAIGKGDAWDTHFTKFGRDPANYPATLEKKMLATCAAQLGLWIFVWTLGSGMLVGWLWMRRQRAIAARGATAGTPS